MIKLRAKEADNFRRHLTIALPIPAVGEQEATK